MNISAGTVGCLGIYLLYAAGMSAEHFQGLGVLEEGFVRGAVAAVGDHGVYAQCYAYHNDCDDGCCLQFCQLFVCFDRHIVLWDDYPSHICMCSVYQLF